AGKTRACLTAGPNQPEHKKTDTPQKLRAAHQPGLITPSPARGSKAASAKPRQRNIPLQSSHIKNPAFIPKPLLRILLL
ncbi:hypothetical protein, partial [Pseudomonas amygdali]